MPNSFVPVALAATRLRITRERLIRLVQTGRVQGKQDDAGRWLIAASELPTPVATDAAA